MVDLEANFSNLTPAQVLIMRTYNRLGLCGEEEVCEAEGKVPADPRYSNLDYSTAEKCGVSVESVGEALVACGRRPPGWWVG